MKVSSLVHRNNCVASFLQNPEWTHLFWVDSDIGFSPEAALRLLQADYEIAAGVYPLKAEEWPADGLPKDMTYAEFKALYQKYTVNARVPAGADFFNLIFKKMVFWKWLKHPQGRSNVPFLEKNDATLSRITVCFRFAWCGKQRLTLPFL